MSNVLIEKDKLDILATAISNKSGEPLKLTLAEMVEAVDGIETGGGGITPTGNIDITHAGQTDVTNYATATVPTANPWIGYSDTGFYTENNQRKWHTRPVVSFDERQVGWMDTDTTGNFLSYVAVPSGTTVTPTESAQTIGGNNRMMEGAVTVNPIPSQYIVPTGTKSITENGTGIDVTEYASVNVSVPTPTPSLQTKTKTYTPTTSTQTESVTADSGYDGIDAVNITVNAMPTGTATAPTSISGASATVSTGTNTLTLSKTVSVTPRITTAGYVSAGTAGNSSVSLTANVTTQGAQTIYPSTSDQTINSGRYLTGNQTIKAVTTSNLTADNIKNGVTVTVGDSADADRVLSVTGTYIGGGGSSMNVQIAQSTNRATSSTYTNLVSLTCSTAGKYDIYWDCFRSSTSGTSGSQLYIGGTAYGTANTVFTNHAQNNHLTNVTLQANQTVAVYARSRGNSYYSYVGTLVIKQTS